MYAGTRRPTPSKNRSKFLIHAADDHIGPG